MICAQRKRLKVSICDNFKNRALNLSSQSHFSIFRDQVALFRSAVPLFPNAAPPSPRTEWPFLQADLKFLCAKVSVFPCKGTNVSLQGYSCFPVRVQLFPCKGTLTNRRPETPERRAETPLRQEAGAVSRKGTKKGRRVGVFLESFFAVCPFRGDRSGAVIPFREYVGCVRQGSP